MKFLKKCQKNYFGFLKKKFQNFFSSKFLKDLPIKNIVKKFYKDLPRKNIFEKIV